jgi:uncharacterized cupredoxin-like copper-binding protein
LIRKVSLLILSVALLTGCTASSAREVPIEMTNYKLSPATVTVKAGEKITFALTNKSDNDHEFESESGRFEEVVVPGGKTRKIDWTAPTKAGDYTFECDMAGHEGMEMTITVAK